MSYQATITNTHPIQPVNGIQIAETMYFDPAIGQPDLLLDFEPFDEESTFADSMGQSNSVTCSDVFVPEPDTMPLVPGAPPAADLDSPVTRIPFGSRLAYNKVGVCLGIARAAIDGFVGIATGKVPRFSSGTLRERPHAQTAVARAEARVRGARAFVLDAAAELWDGVVAGREISRKERALLQIACSDAALACADAVDLLAEAAGTSANRLDCPLERQARDVRVVRQHVTVAPHHLEDAGRVLLGLEPQGLMLGL